MFTNTFTAAALALDAESAKLIWQVPLLGMAMVFSVLIILWAVLAIFKIIFAGRSPKAQKAPKEKKAVSKDTAAQSTNGTALSEGELEAIITAAIMAHNTGDDMIALLTAAVSAYRAENGENAEFRVVAFKRASARAWNSK